MSNPPTLQVLNSEITQKLLPYWNRAMKRIVPQNQPQQVSARTLSFFHSTIVPQMAIPFSSFAEQQSFLKDDLRDKMVMKRAYHNLHHVLELCELYDKELRPRFESAAVAAVPPPQDDIIFLVAFFHDVIYDAKKGDNEELSEKVWRTFVNDNIGELISDLDDNITPTKVLVQQIVNEVSRIILATKSHLKWKPEDNSDNGGPRISQQEILNTKVFLDLDLAILGAPLARYQEYATQIKIEYQHVPPKGFCEGRTAFLKGMLNNSHGSSPPSSSPFFTEIVREMRHKQMVENLTWEIESLSKELEELSKF